MGTIIAPSLGLADAIAAVNHAAATDKDRPILRSVLVEPSRRGVRLVAADNYRIAVCEVDGATADAPLVLALDSALELLAALRKVKTSTDVTLSWGEDPRRVTAEWLGMVRTLEGIDGAYPDYARFIPPDDREGDTVVGVSAALIADAKALCPKHGPKNLVISFNADPHVPLVIRTQGDDRALEVLMPVRIVR